ncbi:MAG: DUF3842 family protein [Lachnospiraceae bacterium]|nr:DUF3842 family protein [Lachnospiraceae bacterium]
MNVLIVDAQGGGVGKQLVSEIRKALPDVTITAVGTNAAATAAMHKAGADHPATGENSVVVAVRKADFILGPIGIVIADAMLGEITPTMARAIAQAEAVRILIPFSHCDTFIAGVGDVGMSTLIKDAVGELKKLIAAN